MSIRFPDLQVLISRVAEISKALPARLGDLSQHHAQGVEIRLERRRRNERVAGNEQSARTALRVRRDASGGRSGRRPHTGQGEDESPGQRIDIEA